MRWFPYVATSKAKIYAVFQFFTLLIVILIAMTIALLYNNLLIGTYPEFDIGLGEILNFTYKNTSSIFISLFVYLIMFLLIGSWLWASLIFRFKARTIFDTLFTLFFFIPLLANVIALIAQITKLPSLAEPSLDEQAIYDAEWARLEAAAEVEVSGKKPRAAKTLMRRRDKE